MYILRIEHPVPDFDGWKKAFDTASQAEALLAAMRVVWGRVEGTIMMNPQARIVEAVETIEY